jgi:DNA invertase Pin-like site-specific DNA recombinase
MPGFPRPTRISTVRSNASSRRGAGGVYAERASGKSTNGRHELGKALKALQPGDTLVTVKLDRLARSIRDLLKLLDDVKEAGARFKALDDPWCDTTTPQGELILTTVVDDDILPLD